MTDRMVTVDRPSGRPMQAYLALPDGAGPFPGVVVIHEILGLNENIKDIARRFAGEGYAALAVDLFSTAGRVMCMARIMHGMLIRPVHNGVVGDLRTALKFLGAGPEVDPARLGVIGFCMGGSYALQLACAAGGPAAGSATGPATGPARRLRAASVFYGLNPRPLEEVARACPIVGSYPELDFTAQAARDLEPALERYQVPHDIKIYPNARHSFFNDQGPAYNTEAAADAWRRTMAFFETYLMGRHMNSSA